MSMRKLFVFLGASILIALTSVVAYASIPAPNGTINGCYTTQAVNGLHGLGVVDSTGVCPAGTTSLNWNQTGPQGPPGIVTFATSSSTATYSVASGTWTAIATVTFNLSQTETVEFVASAQYNSNVFAGMRFSVDGTPISDPNSSGRVPGDLYEFNTNSSSGTYTWSTSIASGSHTVTFEVNGASGSTHTLTVIGLG